MKRQNRCFEILIFVVGLASAPAAVRADESAAVVPLPATVIPVSTAAKPDDPCGAQPWYCDVSQENQARAMAMFEEGNQLFDDSLMVQSVARYREALGRWDHPAIHYNLMLALSALDRPIEAYQSSLAALRHDGGGLQPSEHHRAKDYQRILRGRVAVLELVCDEPGATVTLDGQALLQCPGRVQRLVLPGQHEVVARKPGYLTTHRALVLEAEKPLTVAVHLLPKEEGMVPVQRWSRWKPWTVAGVGAGLALVGGAFQWRSSAANDAFAAQVEVDCAVDGCETLSDDLRAPYRRYTWYQRVANGSYAVGGAVALTGLALVYMNRPSYIENPARRDLVRVTAAPQIGPSSAGVSVNVEF